MIPVKVYSIHELPIPRGGEQYELPAWKTWTPYRATAWAYLHREDGGPFIILAKNNAIPGQHYMLGTTNLHPESKPIPGSKP